MCGTIQVVRSHLGTTSGAVCSLRCYTSLMAIILADGSSHQDNWGAAACVAPQSWSLKPSGYSSVVTFQSGSVDCASAEAYALIAGSRLLRRCRTHPSGPGTVVVDRSAVFSNIVAELDPRQGKLAQDLHYRGVVQTLLQDLQDAANRRQTQLTINIMSRREAVGLLDSDSHLTHSWEPHRLVELARHQGGHQDGALTMLPPRPVPETWNIRAFNYFPDRCLELLVTPIVP